MDAVLAFQPDAILLDLMMPVIDGFELCVRLRKLAELKDTKIIILTAKTYEFDKRRARAVGADAFLVKQELLSNLDQFLKEIFAVMSKNAELAYWGTRGTLPVPGEQTIRYGGNTLCVSLAVDNEPLIIFDAGTGITSLAKHLMARPTARVTAKLLISHPHWDHINAIPFFTPLYVKGNEVEIIGPAHGHTSFREIVSAQMDDVYFPVTIREFGARVYFRDMREETMNVGHFEIKSMLLNHPGACLGYRVNYRGQSVCYITDNEIYPADNAYYNAELQKRLIDFVRDTDILITDCTYLDEEYPDKIGWGHSCTREVAQLAHSANVRALHLFHHDPGQDDEAIDRKLAQATQHLRDLDSNVVCLCPQEGDRYILGETAAP
ncbi:MBL fold metallo-hydrolase [Methylogaea oryzae]|uniref:MBL fold metallo-hydrolase n=1 Tax=Methylogaea oryzae TaxID=1295382 RepID=UPI0006CFA999|nr:MBL fold metallo-hydrolase [Methylogaea oryzae]